MQGRVGQTIIYYVVQDSPDEQSLHCAELLSYICGESEAGFIHSPTVTEGVGTPVGWMLTVMAVIAPYILENHGDL